MTNQEKKIELSRYKNICRRIVQLEEQRQAIIATASAPKSQQLSDMPKGSAKDSELSDLVVQIESLTEDIDRRITESIKIKLMIERWIMNVEDSTEAAVLRGRYINLEQWEKIAVDNHYKYRGILKVHGRALTNLKIN